MIASKSMEIYIPEEILILIFLELPIKTLLRFKSISKSCSNIIHSTRFSYMHFKKSPPEVFPLAIIPKSPSSCDYNFHVLEEQENINSNNSNGVWKKSAIRTTKSGEAHASNFIFLGSCNGLICVQDEGFFNIINPFSSKVIKKVPLPVQCRYCSGFGFDESTHMFKIVIPLMMMGNYRYLRYRIYCLDHNLDSLTSTSVGWRELIGKFNNPDYSISYFNNFYRRPSLFLDGALYWIFNISSGNFVPSEMILTFNLKSELSDVIPLPFSCFVKHPLRHYNCHIFDLYGNLGIVSIRGEDCMKVFKLTKIEGNGNEWIDLYTIKYPTESWYDVYQRFNIKVYGFLNPSSILMNIGNKKMNYFIGNVETGLSTSLRNLNDCRLIICHRGSLIDDTSQLIEETKVFDLMK